jgi:hypothetical protein
LYVQFYSRPIINGAESNEAGRPIYHDVDCIRIMVPGDKLSIIDRLASPDDTQRFSTQFDRYKAGQQTQLVGTPLEQVPWLPRSKVEEYKYFGIHSLEQLAAASDSVGQKFPGFYTDREKAVKFLDSATGHTARIAELERLLAEMQAKMQAPAPTPPLVTASVDSGVVTGPVAAAALKPVPPTVIKGK